ncbi:Cell division ATP-binding protein FtsE [bioreactor metagenome]|uniref:Cell division ATP-binding protein FtsE n=1 Tax=bioreactor metagenome TaxID=1076179 RepID=A0A644YVT7_9ZZZZ
MLTFDSVSKTYKNQVCALDNVSFTIERGEFVYLVGPSGAGKSTILRLLTAEEKPTSGQIIIENQVVNRLRRSRVAALRRRLGVVFQDFRLLPQKTVYENVAFAMQVVEASGTAIRERVPLLLELVGLKDRHESYPNQLSGGEQQRVALARALANDPGILICDEPTGNLDPATSWEIMRLLSLVNERGMTIIMATHDSEMVNRMKHRVIVIENGKKVRDRMEGGYLN